MASNGAVPEFERYRLAVQTHGDHTLQPTRDSTNDLATWQTWRRGRSLGEGGFGEVHQQVWEDEHHDLHYRAVKVCKEQTMQARNIDYKRELSTIAAFSNSQYYGFFVNLHGWWITSGQIFIAMEYLPCGDLSRYGATGLSEAESKEITRNILQGLEVMHKHGFTHRDIKPQNVLVVQKRPEFPSWWVKIADFGISKQVLEDSETALHTTVGSRGYCAPEVLELLEDSQHTSVYTSKVDIWSLGCVVFYMGSQGQRPFSETELLKYCIGRGVFNPRNHPIRLNNKGLSFMKALLQAQPGQRPTATEALQDPWLATMDATVSDINPVVSLEPYPTHQQNFNSFLDSTVHPGAFAHLDRTDLTIRAAVTMSANETSMVPHEPYIAQQQNFNSPATATPTDPFTPHDRTDLTKRPTVAASTQGTRIANELAPPISIHTRNNNTRNPSPRSHTSQSPPAKPINSNPIRAPTTSLDPPRTIAGSAPDRTILQQPKSNINVDGSTLGASSHVAKEDSQTRQVRLNEWLKKNEIELKIRRDRDGETPLYLAAQQEELEMMIFLVGQGADIKAKSNSGWTPLHWAAQNGHLEVAKWLKEQGADIKAKSKSGSTPLHSATWSGHLDVVRWLKEQGADIKAKSNRGWTLLHYAAENGHLEVAKWLKEQGADIKAKNIFGSTPLHYAAENGHLEVAKWLKEQGADIEAKDNNGSTPLHYAAQNGHLEVAKWLKERGADIKAKSNSGWNPLHYAAQNGHLEVAKWLKEQGADVHAKINSGETPLNLAKEMKRTEVVKWLRSEGAGTTTGLRKAFGLV